MIDGILKLFGVVALSEFKAEYERTDRWAVRARKAEDAISEVKSELHNANDRSEGLFAAYLDQKRRWADVEVERNALRDAAVVATKEHGEQRILLQQKCDTETKRADRAERTLVYKDEQARGVRERDSYISQKAYCDLLVRCGKAEVEVAALQQSLDCQKRILAKNATKHQQICDANDATRASFAASHDSMFTRCQKAKIAHDRAEDELAECQEELRMAKGRSLEIARLRKELPAVTKEMWRLAREKDSLEKANKGLKESLQSIGTEFSVFRRDAEDKVPCGTTQEKRLNGDISYLRAKLVSRDKEIENLEVRIKNSAAAYHTSREELKDVCKNRKALYTECGDKKNALKEISEISTRNI